MTRDCRARAIDRKLQHRGSAQLLFPICELRGERLIRQRLPLPRGKVGVLDWRFGKRRFFAFREGAVERHKLFHEDARRPGIEGDVMDRDYDQMVRVVEPDQTRPDDWTTREVEGLAHVAEQKV